MSSVGQLVPPATRPPNMSVKVHGPRIEGSFCSLIDYNYDPIISVICAMYIVFGIVYTLFGNHILTKIITHNAQSWRKGKKCDYKRDWLWVQSPLEDM